MGTRSEQVFMFCSWQDHPHAYGDKTIIFSGNACFVGSSPRVWGQASKITPIKTPKRIIPTRMGTRNPCVEQRSKEKDHPHAYGDKFSPRDNSFLMKGSSPRVWGQDTENYHVTRLDGIIPTRMGTSRQVTFSIVDFGDHPHAYGDKFDR